MRLLVKLKPAGGINLLAQHRVQLDWTNVGNRVVTVRTVQQWILPLSSRLWCLFITLWTLLGLPHKIFDAFRIGQMIVI